MNLTQWFRDQLQTSAGWLFRGVQQAPPGRRCTRPPESLGEWSVARHVFRMGYYERTFALPGRRFWLSSGRPMEVAERAEDAVWNAHPQTPCDEMMLLWVAGKTYQHAAEHTSDVLRTALFWDFFTPRWEAVAAG